MLFSFFCSTHYDVLIGAVTYHKITLEKASRNSKPVKYLEQKIPSLDATRVCVSYAEAKFGRLFFKPITVPGRIWISWRGTKTWKQIKSSSRCCSGGGDAKVTAAFVKGAGIGRDEHVPIGSTIIRQKSNAIFLRECNDFSGVQKRKSLTESWQSRRAGHRKMH
mmetsp:Transcript_23012/g.40387  ORF Transcript_23012/g.40387 Transcript_23012/m.40387 type:complete len:164 (+) Transcript_23012:325-816(+)